VSKKNVEKILFWRACAARTKKVKKLKKTNYHFLLFYHLKVFVLKSSTVMHAACSLACCQLFQQLIAQLQMTSVNNTLLL